MKKFILIIGFVSLKSGVSCDLKIPNDLDGVVNIPLSANKVDVLESIEEVPELRYELETKKVVRSRQASRSVSCERGRRNSGFVITTCSSEERSSSGGELRKSRKVRKSRSENFILSGSESDAPISVDSPPLLAYAISSSNSPVELSPVLSPRVKKSISQGNIIEEKIMVSIPAYSCESSNSSAKPSPILSPRFRKVASQDKLIMRKITLDLLDEDLDRRPQGVDK